MTALFTADDLGEWLGKTVSPSKAGVVEQVVWGWLKGPLGLTERPDPAVPDEVFSWAVELAAIAHENPEGLSYSQLGPERRGFSVERRGQILLEASRFDTGPDGVPAPLGDFPPAQAWPDPIGW